MLDDDLLGFLRQAVRSTWSLELLLLLRGQAPKPFAADELVRALRATPTLMSSCLDQLRAAGLVAREDNGAWRYAPSTPVLDQLAEKLERAYAERPVAVVNAILAAPNERLQSFSDAFRFPKKGD